MEGRLGNKGDLLGSESSPVNYEANYKLGGAEPPRSLLKQLWLPVTQCELSLC